MVNNWHHRSPEDAVVTPMSLKLELDVDQAKAPGGLSLFFDCMSAFDTIQLELWLAKAIFLLPAAVQNVETEQVWWSI